MINQNTCWDIKLITEHVKPEHNQGQNPANSIIICRDLKASSDSYRHGAARLQGPSSLMRQKVKMFFCPKSVFITMMELRQTKENHLKTNK